MTTDTIPEDIAARIGQAIETQRRKDEQEERERAEAEAREQAEVAEAWKTFDEGVNAILDPVLWPYTVPGERDRKPNRFVTVTAHVPGLAPLRISFEGARISRYIVSAVDTSMDLDDGQIQEVVWSFRYGTDCRTLDEALLLAKPRQAAYVEQLADLERANQARAERAQERERQKAEWEQRQDKAEANAERERETEAVRQLREEQLLLDALKEDPIAVGLLKLFAAVQADRGRWQARIDGMEEAAAWTEARHNEHAAQLREEADHFMNEAREADQHARDLDSDLDDVKRKARKAGVKV